MQFNFKDAPTTLNKFEPRLENYNKQRVKAVKLHLEMNRSSSFQQTLWPDTLLEHVESLLWDAEENKRPGVGQINCDTVFTNVELRFVENGTFRVGLKDAKIEKIIAKPLAGKALQIKFQAIAVVTDGDMDGLHDILKNNGVNLTASQLQEVGEAAAG